jgi:hypothetical protein
MAALLTVLIWGERPSWAIALAGGCGGLPCAWGNGSNGAMVEGRGGPLCEVTCVGNGGFPLAGGGYDP